MNSLKDPRVEAVLASLHERAGGDGERWQAWQRKQAEDPANDEGDQLVRLGELYMAFSREEGQLLYILARAMRARHIVEFGASFGVSTTYLAAAAQDVDGKVTTSEAHPDKCKACRANLESAGLADRVTLLEGDARETLATLEPGIDLLVLDGWKGMYLPILELLIGKLRPGALVVADNISHEATQPYLDYMARAECPFQTRYVGELALSTWTGA